MTNNEQLAARLEAAEAGSRELSKESIRYMGWQPVMEIDPSASGGWYSPSGRIYDWMPDISQSVDDGLALLREMGGWRLTASMFHVFLSKDCMEIEGKGQTLALALSAALVRTTGRQKEKERP